MCVMIAISGAILFVLLTPGLLLRIPSKGPLLTASIVHAIVFGILFYFIGIFIYSYYDKIESFKNQKNINAKNICTKINKIGNNLAKFGNSVNPKKLTKKQRKLYINSIDILRNIRDSVCN